MCSAELLRGLHGSGAASGPLCRSHLWSLKGVDFCFVFLGRAGCSSGGVGQQSQLGAAAAAVHGSGPAAQRSGAGAG